MIKREVYAVNSRYYAICGERACAVIEKNEPLSVIAVHSKSVYMRASDGRLLLLCPDSYGRIPFGLAVRDYERLRTERVYTEGETVQLDGGVLCYSDGCRIEFDMVRADITKKSACRLPCDERLDFAERYAYANASRRGMVTVLGVMLCKCVPCADATAYALAAASAADELERGFLCGDGECLSAALRRFIGLGYGLTPSGDDFVCGMAYAFNRYKEGIPHSARCLYLLSASVLPLLDRTNEVSREYIRCALEGERFDVVDGVLDDLVDGCSEEYLTESLELLLSVGASSGSDILCGMLFAFYVLRQVQEEVWIEV